MSAESTEPLHLYSRIYPGENPSPDPNGEVYRHIIGVGDGERTIWIPGYDPKQAREDVFRVIPGMTDNVARYFEEYHVGNLPRTCHIGAAAMTGAGFLTMNEALDYAADIIRRGQVMAELDLPVGAHGVIGAWVDKDTGLVRATHSVVGVAPGLGIQTDDLNAGFSLVSHPHNLVRYQNQHQGGGWAERYTASAVPLELYGRQP
ncbi:MAG TPA: hypothetical protein VLF91_01730 [Candidatus Saccharimonadales bacterium]|nr:hypothetical protein [Candidatus Saccharimonadales bacterium]